MSAKVDPAAGKPATASMLVNIAKLVTDYFSNVPDPGILLQRVSFGTSGHRGSALACSFNEAHILAIAQAVCLYRARAGINGPLFMGKDTHALSEPAFASALEVFAGNDVETMIDMRGGYTPTPVISHAILTYNNGRKAGLADGVVISPSHNPPEDGGFKYNPANGGPADVDVTGWIERTANEIFEGKLSRVKRIPLQRADKASCIHRYDYVAPYVTDLVNVVDLDLIRGSGVRIGIDPLGGAAVHYWEPIIEHYKIAATVVSDVVDPTFRFMTVDWDGKIRMDCSSPYAMERLVALRGQFDIAFANDTDADRHGIVSRSGGLMNPNHYLSTAIFHLFGQRSNWPARSAIGKTIVSSAIIDRVAGKLGRKLIEVPVGFKWFSAGLIDATLGFGGEESAGASFLRRDGSVWTTDKDGLIMGLLAAEMTAHSGKVPNLVYEELTGELGISFYDRLDVSASPSEKTLLKNLSPENVEAKVLAGEPIKMKLSKAPGNGEPIGGIKVVAESGWFAARPSGTEDVYKIYAESFRSTDHLQRIQHDARDIIARLE